MHRARKSLGQNFLVDPNIRRKIVDAIAAGPDDEVLEIGPGQGALTDLLAPSVRRLTAIELDRDLAATLKLRFENHPDVRILEADVLGVPIDSITEATDRLIVVGNIPYNITTPIVFHLLERNHRPAHFVLMVQREVADRIAARSGTAGYGALSVGVQTLATVERLFTVGRNAFRPVPGVDSAVIRVSPIRPFALSQAEEVDLRTLTRTAFNWRRKQIQRTLRSAPEYAADEALIQTLARQTGLDLARRPETLAPAEFVTLARCLRAAGLPRMP